MRAREELMKVIYLAIKKIIPYYTDGKSDCFYGYGYRIIIDD
jgi:hypothetical protein